MPDGEANQHLSEEEGSGDEEKEILIFLKKLRSKSLFEALQFHKENFLECPESDENVSTLPLVKRTIKDAFIALVLFLMR